MLKKMQIFKALDIEIKKQKGPVAIKDPYKGYFSIKEELSQPGISIIAETAGGNPMRGCVRDGYRASTHAKSLIENGANIISVTTDRFLFFGEDKHLSDVRTSVKVPLLRHDFIFEEYQIEESKILGADGIFLMAYLLEADRLNTLYNLAKTKNLDVVIEVANTVDLKRALDINPDIICVLGRDIETWKVDWKAGIELLEKIPKNKCLKLFEAGVNNLNQIQLLESMGVHGVIIGDALLDEFYPGRKLAQILSGIEIHKKPQKARLKDNQFVNKVGNDIKEQNLIHKKTNTRICLKSDSEEAVNIDIVKTNNAKEKINHINTSINNNYRSKNVSKGTQSNDSKENTKVSNTKKNSKANKVLSKKTL